MSKNREKEHRVRFAHEKARAKIELTMLHASYSLFSLSSSRSFEDGSSLFRCIIDSTAGTRRTAFLVQPSLNCGEQLIGRFCMKRIVLTFFCLLLLVGIGFSVITASVESCRLQIPVWSRPETRTPPLPVPRFSRRWKRYRCGDRRLSAGGR